jgi:hypothetical protein
VPVKPTPIGLALSCALTLQACVTTYSAEPIEAWVVDSETGQPIEGAVVTANWELEEAAVFNYRPAGQIMVLETTTDEKGRFYFPQWGPVSTPMGSLNPLIGPPRLENYDPQIRLFKPAYKWQVLANPAFRTDNKIPLRKSEWNGKTIKLERFKGDLKEYANHLGYSDLRFVKEDCNWKKVPTMVLAMNAQNEVFRRSRIESDLLTVGRLEGMSPDDRMRCGSAVEFFNRRQK